jgi:ATP-dependent Clp protease adapter protein ClpS
MSVRLRDSLREMKAIIEEPSEAPVVYLHDPDTGKMFGALVSLEMVDSIPETAWDSMNHSHREGDEDEL